MSSAGLPSSEMGVVFNPQWNQMQWEDLSFRNEKRCTQESLRVLGGETHRPNLLRKYLVDSLHILF